KPAEATILLRARSEGNFVVIQVRDDGRGVDATAVADRAKKLGLPVPERLSPDAVLKILCSPGFSTRDEADMAAGRGVGMSVVANVVRELAGVVTLETELGAWTQFTLKLPLTLSIADAIIVKVGGQPCAVLQAAVDEIIQVPAAELRTINQTAVIPYRRALLPLVFLRKIFQQPDQPAENLTVLVLGSERGAAGLVVDGVRGQREIVVRPLADPLLRVPGFSGTTELGDGRPLLILDSLAITRGVVRPPEILPADESPDEIARAS
ncbi:MAG: CheA signal transduction histidine kinase, partial [Verrucomicrobia bacterium]|nr:CheA signal transduction histidine kinase [Verrucomicrobiota bacterium]